MSTDKRIHIVSFDVPYPANYGGVIDVFYRLKALHELGVKITLHCFEYGRGEQSKLQKYAETVHYYKRKKSVVDSIGKTPFIVKSRNSKLLIENLLKDDSPILFEGLHTCYFLDDPRLENRTKIVRAHNIEHEYYYALSLNSSGLKKQFFSSEAKKLRAFELKLKHADVILAIKESDAEHFSEFHLNTMLLPASSPDIKIDEKVPTEPYCLFHGNLSVEENEEGAMWLINEVFLADSLDNKLKIAGKGPSAELVKNCSENNIELIPDPSDDVMNELIQRARVHVFYTSQATGVKLKLLNAMASSGHIIVNDLMVLGTNLGSNCTIQNGDDSFYEAVEKALSKELSTADFQSRIDFLKSHYNTTTNCKIILDLL